MNFAKFRRWCCDHDVDILLIVIVIVSLVGGFFVGHAHRGRVDAMQQRDVVTTSESTPQADLPKDQKVAVNRLRKAGYVIRIQTDLDDKTITVFVSGSVVGAHLAEINLDGFNFGNDVSLSGADLTATSLESTDLSFANLKEARLAKANMYRTDLSLANMRGANLKEAKFYHPNLTLSDLRQADLRGAVLDGASLPSTDLREADLRSTDLSRCELETIGINNKIYKTDLEGARYDRATRWPDGFDPKAAGAILVK